MHILIASADPVHAKLTRFLLEGERYEVSCAAEEQAIWQQLHTDRIDLVLLDGEFANRLELCQEIRAHYHRAIILTAESGPVSERVRALNLGADDVLSKPYSPTELLARIHAVMRRYDDDYLRIHSAYRSLAVGPLKLHPLGRRVVIGGKREELLTQREFQLLYYLVQNAGCVLSSQQLLEQIWGMANVTESNVLSVYIRRLRRKIERDPMRPNYIVRVRDLGYSFQP